MACPSFNNKPMGGGLREEMNTTKGQQDMEENTEGLEG